MHWDFYTLLSVLSGIVLIAASLAGPVVGTARERLSFFAVGAFSFIYGIWVATQTSGFFMFSVAPAGLAVLIIVRAVQHAGQAKPAAPAGASTAAGPQTPSRPGGPPRHGAPPRHEASPALEPPRHPEGPGARHGRRTTLSALQAAQPERVRQAVDSTSRSFCPAFLLPGSSEVSAPGDGLDYYLSEPLTFGWSLADGKPRLPRGEELFGLWQAGARVKVAVGRDLNPTTPRPGVSWVTVLDGTGLIALSRYRVIGVVVRGDSLLGAFDGSDDTGIALWSLPLRRFSSVSMTAVEHGEGLVLSSAEPAGHVTLTGIRTAGAPGRQAAAVPPEHVADMINRARADVPTRIG